MSSRRMVGYVAVIYSQVHRMANLSDLNASLFQTFASGSKSVGLI
jgi:hypothetical protein